MIEDKEEIFAVMATATYRISTSVTPKPISQAKFPPISLPCKSGLIRKLGDFLQEGNGMKYSRLDLNGITQAQMQNYGLLFAHFRPMLAAQIDKAFVKRLCQYKSSFNGIM